MEPAVVAVVLFAAGLHLAWNVLLKTAGDPLRTAFRGLVVAGAVLVPGAIAGWFAIGRPAVPPEAFVLGAISGLLEAAYFVFLAAAYRRGDLSLVYPTARGTAPLLSVLFGIVVLGERLGPAGTVGVVLLLAGILALQRPWRALRRAAAGAAGPLAVATGVTISLYSTVDRVGVRLTEAWLYAAIFWVVTIVALGAWILATRPAVDLAPATWVRAGTGGLVTLGAYVIILAAYQVAPLTAVAPLRETAIVFASGWGAIRLREARDRREAALRIGAAAVVVVGAALLAMD